MKKGYFIWVAGVVVVLLIAGMFLYKPVNTNGIQTDSKTNAPAQTVGGAGTGSATDTSDGDFAAIDDGLNALG